MTADKVVPHPSNQGVAPAYVAGKLVEYVTQGEVSEFLIAYYDKDGQAHAGWTSMSMAHLVYLREILDLEVRKRVAETA